MAEGVHDTMIEGVCGTGGAILREVRGKAVAGDGHIDIAAMLPSLSMMDPRQAVPSPAPLILR
jgi:hypothetical protein